MSERSGDDTSQSGSIGTPGSSDDQDSRTGTTTSGSRASGEDNLQAIKDRLSKNETKAVFRLRVLVVFVLLCASAAISVVVYKITRDAQINVFHIQYEGAADKVIQSFADIVKKMGAISGLSLAACSHSTDNESSWPLVTLSNFQERAGNARALSGALFVSINPLVEDRQRALWEQYVLENNTNEWM